jgi:hypothetical protein
LDEQVIEMKRIAQERSVAKALRSAMFSGCTPGPDTDTFLRLDEACETISVIGNDFSRTSTPVQSAAPEDMLYETANRI